MTPDGLWKQILTRWEAAGVDRGAVALDVPAEGVTLSFAALDARVERAAGWWAAQGVGPGDVVALMLPRSLAFLELLLGALRLGAVAVPMNDRYTEREVSWILEDCRPKRAILMDEGVRASLDAHVTPAPAAHPDADAPALYGYTSGTTGRPKAAILLHRNLIGTLDALHRAWGWTPDDVLLHALPLNHVHGLIVAQLGALWAGARTWYLPKFEPAAAWEAIARERVTIFMGVPTLYTRLLAEPGTPDLRAVRLFTCGSAPLPAHVFRAFERRFGHTVLERYGMTEIGMALSNPLLGERRPGSVGLPLPGVSLRITDAEGEDVPRGEIGELRICGPGVFAGYLGRPEATAAALVDGWMRTGDLGFQDPDGYVHLTGRGSELILVGGLNVYPREVEACLLEHPDVADAAVLGVPDADLGEVPGAAVVLRAPVDPDALRAWCRARLAPYKVPRAVRGLEQLPRNTMGKIMKSELRPMFASVTIRDARPDEAAEIADRNVAMARETEELALDPEVARAGAEAVFTQNVGASYLIAELGGAPVGQLMLTTEWSDWRNRPVWWIQSVYVAPRARRAGVFRALYDEVIRRATAAGAGGVRLYVDRRNTRAAQTYQQLGMNGEHYLVFERMFDAG